MPTQYPGIRTGWKPESIREKETFRPTFTEGDLTNEADVATKVASFNAKFIIEHPERGARGLERELERIIARVIHLARNGGVGQEVVLGIKDHPPYWGATTREW